MKHITLLLALLISMPVIAQAQSKQIQKKGTITIVENGQKHEYIFDVDSTITNANVDVNDILENLNTAFEYKIEDSVNDDENVRIEKIIFMDDSTFSTEGKNEIVVVEDDDKTQVHIGNKELIRIEEGGDTVVIKIGKKVMRVVENNKGSVVTFDDDEDKDDVDADFDWDWDFRKKDKKKFKGHYGLMEFGVNTFTDPDYSMYTDPRNFMDLNHNKAREFNLNVFWQSFGLQKNKGNFGLVTGLGFSWNNYFFAKDVTLAQGDEMIEPIFTNEVDGYGYVEKTKLVASYLTIPLLLEIHLTQGKNPLYMQVGAIGGIKLGSHTKVKHSGNKDKDFSDFYLAPFRYGATARIGYGSVYLYGTYYASEMFRDDRGPVMNPYTIGIGFPAF